MANNEPKVISRVEQIDWFQSALDRSEETLRRTAAENLPSWYREHADEGEVSER